VLRGGALSASMAAVLAASLASRAGLAESPSARPAAATTAETPAGRQILLQADSITYDTRAGIVTAEGHVQISDDQRTLMADRVTYDQNTGTVTASGNVSLQDQFGNVAFADRVQLTQDLREGALQGFSALIGKYGRLAASAAERREGRFTIVDNAIYTPCKICANEGERMPLWQIRARRIIHDQLAKELYFEDASFEFLGATVFYLPFFSEADPTVKYKSGFLLPDIGSSSTLGSFLKIPYYISFSPSQDITFDPILTTDAGDVMQAEYRQRFADGGFWLQGSFGSDPNARSRPGGSSAVSSLFGGGRLKLTDTWNAGFDVQLSSSKTYLKAYEISYADRLTSDLFVDRVDGRSRFGATGYFFQGLRAGDIAGEIPLALPFLEYTYIPETRFEGGRLQLDASALMLTRDIGSNVVRGSVDAQWRRPFTTANGQLFTLQALLRGDTYYITDATFDVPTASRNTETIGRGLGLAMLEWRYPFVSDAMFGNTTVIIEPIAQVIAASVGGNPQGLPNEDSTSFEFNATNLFSPNFSPGLDIWTGGPRSNVGVRVSALLPSGYVEATLGEEFRLATDRFLPTVSGLGDRRSDVVGQIKLDFPPNLVLTHQFSIDPTNGTIRRNEFYITGRFGRSTIDLGYLKLPPSPADPTLGEQEQINLSTTVEIYENWGIFVAARRDIAKNRMLESSVGLKYEDECFTASLGFHRRETALYNLKPASSVIFRIGLKTGLTGG
jgi:LPS-assembly protein